MSKKMEAVKTPVPAKKVFTALGAAWLRLLDSHPKKESLLLLLAHWGLETGHGKSMWCHNLGNVKAKVGGAFDYCYFACNEILDISYAESLAKKDPERVRITLRRSDGKAIVWFHPEHPACCFRAFETIEAGALDHLDIVHRRFIKAWPHVVAAAPSGFCKALRQQGYYTADETPYTKAVVSVFERYKKELAEVQVPKSVQLDLPLAEFNISPLQSAKDDEFCGVYGTFVGTFAE